MSKKPKSVGENIRKLRSEQSVTLKDLAKRAGVSVQTVWGLEKMGREPHKATLQKIAKALNTTTEILLGGEVQLENERASFLPSLHGMSLEDMLHEIDRRGFTVKVMPKISA